MELRLSCTNPYVFLALTHRCVSVLIIHKSQYINKSYHYNDVITSTMASQITSLMIVYSTVYSGTDQRKQQSSASLAFARRMTGEFPAQRASNAENVSIWWHHMEAASLPLTPTCPPPHSCTHYGSTPAHSTQYRCLLFEGFWDQMDEVSSFS